MALAMGAHAAGGGSLPHPSVLGALTILLTLTAVIVTRFRLNLLSLIALLGAGQWTLHEAFGAFGPALVSGHHGAAAPGLGHQSRLEAMTALSAMASSPAPEAVVAHHDTSSPLMVIFHLLATILCALALTAVENDFWALEGWLSPLFKIPRRTRIAPAPRLRPLTPRPALRVSPWRQHAPPPLRGPPAAPAFA